MPPPVFFVSYARQDVEYLPFRQLFKVFVDELRAKVATALGVAEANVCFTDGDIQTGELWTDRLRDEISQCKVGLVLLSPSYFARPWCGREFQILLDRSRPAAGGSGIVPVLWAKKGFDFPAKATQLQFKDDTFPPEYTARGMRKLVEMRECDKALYSNAVDAIVERIVDEARKARLAPLDDLDFEAVHSAWDTEVANDPNSHKQGSVSKTCFVYLSRRGWGWVPYEGAPTSIGALAQRITGDLGVRYEEIDCGDDLSRKLKEANDGNVPTVLFGDPESFSTEPFARSLNEYDRQYFLNCATLVPWGPDVKTTIDTDPRWIHLRDKICPQKVTSPPPFHEWRSIFSLEDLSNRTEALIEQVRSRLINHIMSGKGAANSHPLRVEDADIERTAAERGIPTAALPSLSGPVQ